MGFFFPRLGCYAMFLLLGCLALPAQTFTKLLDFDGVNGMGPAGALVEGPDGNLYGSTTGGGTGGLGTIFKLGLDGSFVKLHDFCVIGICDGMFPQGLTVGRDGNLYGGASTGGLSNDGTVYRITPQGVFTLLHSFNQTDGIFPGILVQGKDGNFYGGTVDGGTHNRGTLFKISPSGKFRILHNLCLQKNCMDGGATNAPLVQASDGNFYGISMEGGPIGGGLIFKITPSGAYSVLYEFCSLSHCADGRWPLNGLTIGTDGNLYGVTFQGGGGGCFRGCGTFFKITLSGVLTTLHTFTPGGISVPSLLVLASDGNFYGTSGVPGGIDTTVIVRFTPSGVPTVLYQLSQSDGAQANSLMQASDGNFYGTALLGGANFDDGTLFRFSLTGQ